MNRRTCSSSSSSPSTGVGPPPDPDCARWNKYACSGASSVKSGGSSRTRVPRAMGTRAKAPRKPAGVSRISKSGSAGAATACEPSCPAMRDLMREKRGGQSWRELKEGEGLAHRQECNGCRRLAEVERLLWSETDCRRDAAGGAKRRERGNDERNCTDRKYERRKRGYSRRREPQRRRQARPAASISSMRRCRSSSSISSWIRLSSSFASSSEPAPSS